MDENTNLRQRSGEFSTTDKLTVFLYHLMRDKLPAGEVEALVQKFTDGCETWLVSNGWLGKYAEDLARRLKGE